jgi:phosphoribosyl-dephospho-CoA transferase
MAVSRDNLLVCDESAPIIDRGECRSMDDFQNKINALKLKGVVARSG